MQTGGGDATPLQLQDLILHHHQGGNDHDKASAQQRRQLITKGFTAAGGQHCQGITPSQNGFHNRTLTRPETRPAEMFLERPFQTVQSHQI